MAVPHRVLVVEDDETIRQLLAVVLEDAGGHALDQAADGEAALALARRDRPAVLVLDMRLPRLDGYEVARRLRADPATRRCWIVGISANGRSAEALAAGCDQYLTKPLDIGELERAVMEGLGRHAAAGA
jgi:CheY-like chemotaxis protein